MCVKPVYTPPHFKPKIIISRAKSKKKRPFLGLWEPLSGALCYRCAVHDCVEITPLQASGGAYGLLVGWLFTLLWEMVRNSGGLARWISPGDGRPSTRCGNVAVVALFLLANRKLYFQQVWHAGSFKGLKPEIVWWPGKLIQNPWTRELTSNPPECFPSVGEIAVVYPASHQRSEKQYLTIPVKYL